MTRVNEDVASLPRPIGPTQPNEQGETTQGDHPEVEGTLSCKKRKLAIHDARNDSDNEDGNNYFVLINMSILMNLISSLGKCPECGSTVEVIDLLKLRMGFANKILVRCASCCWQQSTFLSEQCSPTTGRGRNFFEVNVRTVIAFREIGKGHQAIQSFSRCMNMKGVSENAYGNLNQELYNAYENAADASKAKAAFEIKQSGVKELDGKHLCQCSLDGSWQKRGHASLNGVVTAILLASVWILLCLQRIANLVRYGSQGRGHKNMKTGLLIMSAKLITKSHLEPWKLLEQLTYFAHPLKSMD